MILSGIRIYAHLVKFYCRALHTLSSILWDSYTFQCDTCNRLWINCRDTEPPWPNILKRIFNVIAIFFVFLSVNFMVIELVLFYTKNAIKQYIYEWKYKFFKDCQLIPSEYEQYFFDCQDYILPSNQNTTNPSVQQENCHICHEKYQSLQYNIKLPVYQQALLTALQNNGEYGVYATFDPETEHCVVDNCANVHIWNEYSSFIPSSYMKLNSACSTAVSAVNGQSNLPTGCGDVPVEWTDDNGKVFKITLKNVLHFPNSPVKILSVVGLADQLKDE